MIVLKGFGTIIHGETVGFITKDIPEPKEFEALLEPVVIAPCTSDVHITFEQGHNPARNNRILGHESVGRIVKLGAGCTPVKDQATALMEVAAGTADAAVIDALMAGAMVGEGTGYETLAYTVSLNADEGEQYGVGFRKGSDLTQKLNEFFHASFADGSMQKAAETYGIQAALCAQ